MNISGNAPRILCFDDYFLEEEEEEVDDEDEPGKKKTVEVMKYHFEPSMVDVCNFQTIYVSLF